MDREIDNKMEVNGVVQRTSRSCCTLSIHNWTIFILIPAMASLALLGCLKSGWHRSLKGERESGWVREIEHEWNMCTCVYMCVSLCVCVCMYVMLYVCIYVCAYICAHVCICIAMYIYLCRYVCYYDSHIALSAHSPHIFEPHHEHVEHIQPNEKQITLSVEKEVRIK